MTPEGRVKGMVKKALTHLGPDVWRFMPVQTGFGAPALDFLCAIRGRFVAIETKAPGKRLTPLQQTTKAAIEAAGGIVLEVWDEGSLAIAMKIILALEFSNANEGYTNLANGLAAATRNDRSAISYTAVRIDRPATSKRGNSKHLRPEQPDEASDPATGGDHGAPGSSSD